MHGLDGWLLSHDGPPLPLQWGVHVPPSGVIPHKALQQLIDSNKGIEWSDVAPCVKPAGGELLPHCLLPERLESVLPHQKA
jgi:hypothetical protein